MGSYSGGCICLSSPWSWPVGQNLLDFVELRKQLKTHYCIFFPPASPLEDLVEVGVGAWPPYSVHRAPSPSANFIVLNCWLQRKRIDRRPPLWSFWCNVSRHPNYNWTPIKVLYALPGYDDVHDNDDDDGVAKSQICRIDAPEWSEASKQWDEFLANEFFCGGIIVGEWSASPSPFRLFLSEAQHNRTR